MTTAIRERQRSKTYDMAYISMFTVIIYSTDLWGICSSGNFRRQKGNHIRSSLYSAGSNRCAGVRRLFRRAWRTDR